MSTNRNASGQAGAKVLINTNFRANYNIEQQFRQEMHAAGIQYSGEIIPDGKLHRIHVDGHRRGSLNGAYVLHADGCPAGWFQDYTSGISQTWKLTGGQKAACDPVKIAEVRQRREAERLQAHKKAAESAAYIWQAEKLDMV